MASSPGPVNYFPRCQGTDFIPPKTLRNSHKESKEKLEEVGIPTPSLLPLPIWGVFPFKRHFWGLSESPQQEPPGHGRTLHLPALKKRQFQGPLPKSLTFAPKLRPPRPVLAAPKPAEKRSFPWNCSFFFFPPHFGCFLLFLFPFFSSQTSLV